METTVMGYMGFRVQGFWVEGSGFWVIGFRI